MEKNFYKRILIKIGSSSLTHNGGRLNLSRIDHFLRQMVDLKNQGRDVLFVTSAAIGAGMAELGIAKRPKMIPEQQAMAAVGQAQLMTIYNRFLREYGIIGAQILLTSSDLEDRNRYLNAYNTMESLLKCDVIPIINENDTIATHEIKFGDNDTLSARVAGLMEADLLIILSDIDGLYNGDPHLKDDVELISKVEEITPDIEKLAGGTGSKLGTGGMETKIAASKIAVNSGITMVIGPGYQPYSISRILEMLEEKKDYSIGTTFLPVKNSLSKRKHWLLYNPSICGKITVDEGAERALMEKGKSLLPGGVTSVSGSFRQGDPVAVMNLEKKIIAKGLVNYSVEEVERIKGHHSSEISIILGYINGPDVIHRDNLVLENNNK